MITPRGWSLRGPHAFRWPETLLPPITIPHLDWEESAGLLRLALLACPAQAEHQRQEEVGEKSKEYRDGVRTKKTPNRCPGGEGEDNWIRLSKIGQQVPCQMGGPAGTLGNGLGDQARPCENRLRRPTGTRGGDGKDGGLFRPTLLQGRDCGPAPREEL